MDIIWNSTIATVRRSMILTPFDAGMIPEHA